MNKRFSERMPFSITMVEKEPGYHPDYIGWAWKVGTLGYFFYKVSKKEPFHYLDAIWLFTSISVKIPEKFLNT